MQGRGKRGDPDSAISSRIVWSERRLLAGRHAFLGHGEQHGDRHIRAGHGGEVNHLLFAFTYLWVACNRFSGADGRGLGWFSLFVALTAVPVAMETLSGAQTTLDWWLGLNWAAWALLWALFFVLLALQKKIDRPTGWLCIAQGVLTGWLPGYLILAGRLS